MTSLRKPIAADLPTTPMPFPAPMPKRIPNPATMLLAGRLRAVEREYSKNLDARYWHETMAHRAELACDRLSAERHDIELAMKAVAAREVSGE